MEIIEKFIDDCFERNEYFDKMIELINSSEEGEELHHIIPRSYFRNKGLEIIDEGNLISLPYEKHILIHYYVYKCCKPIIKPDMTYAADLMLRRHGYSLNGISEEEIKSLKVERGTIQHKKVVCLDTAVVYPSRKEASKTTGVSEANITEICNHNYYSSHGLHFEWATKDSYTIEECKPMIRVYHRPTTRVRNLDTGKEYNSIAEAALDMKVPRGKIVACCLGDQKSVYGTHWEYIDGPRESRKKRKIICLETNQVFESIKECARVNNLDERTLQRNLGTRRVTKGFHYDYYEEGKTYTVLDIEKLYEVERIKKKHNNKRKIICLELLKTFESIEEANEYFGVEKSKISECIRGVRKTALNMHFEYFQTDVDYVTYVPKRIEELGGRNTFIKCLETNQVFSSLREAARETNTSRESINISLKESRPINGKTWKLATFEEWFRTVYPKLIL